MGKMQNLEEMLKKGISDADVSVRERADVSEQDS